MPKTFVVIKPAPLGQGITVNEYTRNELTAAFASNRAVLDWALTAERGRYLAFGGCVIFREY